MTLNHLSLFSGIGGFELGMQLAGLDFQTIGYVEKDKYCQAVLQERMNDGYLDTAPIIRDITECDFRPMAGLVDCITGGFPCQPHSSANHSKQKGATDARNLWPETLGCIRQVEPRWVLLENVPGILANGYGETVVGQLAEIGYDCIWHCVPAAAVGAPHLRWRWWCLAVEHTQHDGWIKGQESEGVGSRVQYGKTGENESEQPTRSGGRNGRANNVANANGDSIRHGEQLQGQRRSTSGTPAILGHDGQNGNVANAGWWTTEPDVGRVANGIPRRVDRLKSLGNGVVPAVVARVCEELIPLAKMVN